MGVGDGAFDLTPFRAEYPWSGHFLDRDGHRMHYLDEGQGDVLVFLHGNPTWSFFWRHLIRDLSQDHRTIAPDHMGCGLSDKPSEAEYAYTLENRVSDVEALLDSLGVRENVTLVLHDWGGMIGLAFARRFPERIRRLVLLNTAGFLLPTGRSLPWQLKLARNAPFTSLLTRGLNLFSLGAAHTCSTRPGRMTPALRKAYLAPYDSWAHRVAVHRFVQDIPLDPSHPSYALVKDVDEHLSDLDDRPVVICWGGRDFVFDASFLAEWRSRLPSAQVHLFPEAGHYVLEDAHEEIVPIVRGFLADHPLAASSG